MNGGFYAEYVDDVRIPNILKIKGFDVVYGIYLQTCSRYITAAEMLGKISVIHFQGSDAYRYAREKGLRKIYWKTVINASDLILYVASHLVDLVGKQGVVLPVPINVELLKKSRLNTLPERDVLYYCPGGKESSSIYRLDWIIDYARRHPDEKITIIGNESHPAEHDINLSNVTIIPFVPNKEMGKIYAQHKRLIRMTTQDGMPRMLDEAVICGLDVMFNGRKIRKVLPERYPDRFVQRFSEELQKIM